MLMLMQPVRLGVPGALEPSKKFIWHRWYTVIEDYDIQEPNEPQFRLRKTFCYKLRVGMKLRFKGPNWDGMASFACKDGRLVFLTTKTAFRVIGCTTDGQPG